MFVLTFEKSRSKYFEKALEISKLYNGDWDGKTMTIRIPDEVIINAYDILLPLISIVGKWSSLKATYNNEKVLPYRFLFSIYLVKECAKNTFKDNKNCWLSHECKGWGCRMISNIDYLERGSGNYKKSNRFWYNFGYFNQEGVWIINKEVLSQKLEDHIKRSNLNKCPYFDMTNIKHAIENLPNEVIPDNINYKIHYAEIFVKGQKIQVPENIRHISKFPEGNDSNLFNGRLFARII